jgi:parvulin-like peptidyl-prolyl cis-trans isomerase-like protein
MQPPINPFARLTREPLLHFLLIGAVLFCAYAWRNRTAPTQSKIRQVRVSQDDVLWLKENWAKQWQREPTRDELRGLVTEFLKEELLAREAREMGLDQNDMVVRRRLAQKVEFLVQDTSQLVEPTEDDLRKFYSAHPERFSEPARVSFTHVYFSQQKRKDAAADAKAALVELSPAGAERRPPGDPQIGDPLLLDLDFRDLDRQAVAGQFGEKFAAVVFAQPAGSWRGPIESGFGLHLVRVLNQTPARQREFAQVRLQVLERWREQRRQESNREYFAGLLKKYDVVVDERVTPLVGALNGSAAGGGIGPGEEPAK